MKSAVILTVVGSDRPGLTHALADAVFRAEGNWLESHLTRLGSKYVGAVLVELPEANLDQLRAMAEGIDAEGLRVTMVNAGLPAPPEGREMLLDLVGQDRPGIVNEVTTVLAKLNVNIEDLATSIENSSWSGDLLFRAKARLLLPAGTSPDEVRDALERISGEIMADIEIATVGKARQ